MEQFPEDINYYLFNNINDIETLHTVIQLNNYCYKNSINKYKNLLDYINYIKNRYPDFVIKLFGNIYNLISYPILPFKQEFLGSSDLLDKIKVSDVSHPIMIGEDSLGRLFITFKLKFKSKIESAYFHNINDDTIEVVSTFFQKYTNAHSCKWVFNTLGQLSINKNTLPTTEELENYKKIINGEVIETEKYFVSL